MDTQSVQTDASLASFTITPPSHDFGSLTMGMTSAPQNFTVTNNGESPSGTPTVQVSGNFTVSTNGCMNPVPAGMNCVVAVDFRPQSTGLLSGTLTVTTSDGMPATASLSGTGTAAPRPAQFEIKETSHHFGWLQVGKVSPDVIFRITNVGESNSSVPTLGMSGDTKDFQMNFAAAGRRGFCPDALPPNGSCSVNVFFAPTSAAGAERKRALLEVVGSPGGAVSATLTGNALAMQGGLEIHPNPDAPTTRPGFHDFGTVSIDVRFKPTIPFMLINTQPAGTPPMEGISFSNVSGWTTDPDFVINDEDCLITHKGILAPGDFCTILVRFNAISPPGSKQLTRMAEAKSAPSARAAFRAEGTAQ